MSTESSASIRTRTIKWLYIVALSMVAVLTITGQVLVQWSLSALQGDSTTVNIAGRQRMLSQRIPRLIMALDAERRQKQSDTVDEPIHDSSAAELRDSLDIWRANHMGLATASSDVGLARANSQPISELFAKIEPEFKCVEQLAELVCRRFLVAEGNLITTAERALLLNRSDAFLSAMDAIVAQYENEAKQRVSKLQRIERGLLLATLLVLACEGGFIFLPTIASLDRAFQRLKAVTGQLELAKVSAEQANRAKTQFLTRVSHELRTPLHAILGMLSLIRQGRLTPAQQQRTDLAYHASRTLRHLVDDLLDISRVESGSALTLQLAPTNVAKLVQDCVELMGHHARRRQLDLFASSEIPSGRLYLLDEFRLRQILINLIQNAIRYTSAGQIECRTWLEPLGESSGEAWVNLTVRDTGCGIAAEHLAGIFENFVRIPARETTQVMGPRLGLGLSISASLVESMRGTIRVDSQLGAGSVFTVRLPVTAAPPNSELQNAGQRGARAEATAPTPTVPSSAATRVPRVAANSPWEALIVDDSKVNRLLLRAYLKRLGVRVCSTNNLTRALRLFEERHPRLVLLDLHLGQENSLSLVRDIRSQPDGFQAAIYFITAEGHFTLASCPDHLAVAGVLCKPIDFEEISAALELCLPALAGQEQPSRAEEQDEFGALRAQLRRQLVRELPAELGRLNAALASSDYAAIALIAHRLRGSAANAGWSELAEAAAIVESCPGPDGELLRAVGAILAFGTMNTSSV